MLQSSTPVLKKLRSKCALRSCKSLNPIYIALPQLDSTSYEANHLAVCSLRLGMRLAFVGRRQGRLETENVGALPGVVGKAEILRIK